MEKSNRNEAIITFDNKDATVDFKGVWTRSMVDSAHRCMLRALPAHVAHLRSKDEGETTNNEEN